MMWIPFLWARSLTARFPENLTMSILEEKRAVGDRTHRKLSYNANRPVL
jgi:hypothetical protein